MNWYLAKIIYRIICGDGEHTAQFDEQIRLVSAVDREAALEKSRMIGRQEEDIFPNNRQQMVQWKFINVTEIYELEELVDGAEVYSQVKEIDDADAYCSFVQHKAGLLHQKYSPLIN